ncbi:MAG: alpha/beta fold hydrolase [Acidimicrobiales bacterium]
MEPSVADERTLHVETLGLGGLLAEGAGEGAAPFEDRERVVLVHGFTQSGRSWQKVADELSPTNEVLLPDLPGHGRSPLATGDFPDSARLLGESCGRASYVGYSLGGRCCLQLCFELPDLVERLVVVSATAGIEDSEARIERAGSDSALADRLEAEGPDGLAAFIDEWLAGPLFAHLDGEAADRSSRLVNTGRGLASALHHLGVGTQLPLWERLRELSMPVLVIAGEEDAAYVELGERMAAAIGENALFVLVPGAGHAVPFEQPDTFARLVSSFVRGEVGPGPLNETSSA